MKQGNAGMQNYTYANEETGLNDGDRYYNPEKRPYGTPRPVSNIMEGDSFPSPVLNQR